MKTDAEKMLAHVTKVFEARFKRAEDGPAAAYVDVPSTVEGAPHQRTLYVTAHSGDPILHASASDAIDAWLRGLLRAGYAKNADKTVLVWRVRPKIEHGKSFETGESGWRVYSRLAIYPAEVPDVDAR